MRNSPAALLLVLLSLAVPALAVVDDDMDHERMSRIYFQFAAAKICYQGRWTNGSKADYTSACQETAKMHLYSGMFYSNLVREQSHCQVQALDRMQYCDDFKRGGFPDMDGLKDPNAPQPIDDRETELVTIVQLRASAERICNDGGWRDRSRDYYRKSCATKAGIHMYGIFYADDLKRGVTQCEERVLERLDDGCRDFNQAGFPNVDNLLQPLHPVNQGDPAQTPNGSPSVAQQAQDRNDMKQLCQQMLTLSDQMCRQPMFNEFGSAYCDDIDAWRALRDRYIKTYKLPEPVDCRKEEGDECASELMTGLLEHGKDFDCHNVDFLQWVRSQVNHLHYRYYDENNKRRGGVHGPRETPPVDKIPDGCHRMDGGGVGCPPASL